MELFETFDDAGRSIGLVPRDEVHRLGLWHRASHVFVFRSSGALVVQRRADDKDLYAGLLDFSVGEHLQPRETHEAAALRGLEEELGVTGVAVQPLGGRSRMRYVDDSRNVRDFEIHEAFKTVYDGDIVPDAQEVAEVVEFSREALAQAVRDEPQRFTALFCKDLRRFGFI